MFEAAFDHFHLRSLDPDEAARFYVEHLGAEISNRVETDTSLRVILVLAGLRLFIERAPETTPAGPSMPYRGLEHFGLRVADIDAAVAQLERAGVEFTMPITVRGPDLRIAFLRGPDNVSIELLERKAA
jgi:catechol 2,3-dioxygenase-like lactoylglutathione lyase family enzyme